MVLGLRLREDEERRLVFDFESLLPDDGDDNMDGGRNGAVVGVGGATYGNSGPKKDFKRGTVVCRHWLRALCMKGDNCEFLHQYDMSKMPECRWGMECQVPECPFRHVPDEERVECAFYRQGFCSHGSSCRYRHIKLAREECPETADFTLQAKVADEENVKRRKAQPVNEFFKIAICKHWDKTGSCPFGDECHFAHGDKELRPFPKGEKESGRGGKSMGDRHHNDNNRGPHGFGNDRASPAAPPIPLLPDENKLSKYFLVQSASYQNLAHSVHHKAWSVPKDVQNAIKMATETSDAVFLFFTVGTSKHYQGVARIVRGAFMNAESMGDGEDLAANIVPFDRDGKTSWSGSFGVEWLRICECPWERLALFENKQVTVPECPNGHELDAETGHALMRLLFNQAQIRLHYRSVEDEPRLAGGAEELANRRREAAERVSGGAKAYAQGGNANGPGRKVALPGFIFGCTSKTIDESFGRMLFGLPRDEEQAALKHIVPGTPLFLLNMSDNHLMGIFEAISPPVVNMIPGAFANGPRAPSPLPVQVRIIVALNGPAINSADPQIQQVVGERGVRVGPLSVQSTQKLAEVFVERCSAAFQPAKQQGLPGPPPTNPSQVGGSARVPDAPVRPGPPPASTGVSSGAGTSKDSASADGGNGNSDLFERFVVGIEPDNEFGVTRRIIGPGGSYMKRISVEAGSNATIRVRGRGSGSKESSPEEEKEPLMILVSAENERSFRIAVNLTKELLANIHRDHQAFLAQKQQRAGPPSFHGGGYGGPPLPPPMGNQFPGSMRGPPPPPGPGFGQAPHGGKQ